MSEIKVRSHSNYYPLKDLEITSKSVYLQPSYQQTPRPSIYALTSHTNTPIKETNVIFNRTSVTDIKHLRGNSLNNRKKRYDEEVPELSEGGKSLMMRSRKKAKYLTVISRMPINRKKNSIVV